LFHFAKLTNNVTFPRSGLSFFAEIIICVEIFLDCDSIVQDASELHITARQYGEVVLPDAASGRKIVPVGQKAVTVQGGYGAIFAVMVQILPSITSVGVQG